MLRIYNTLTRRKEEFQTLEPGKVKMYVCGVTVYNDAHVWTAESDAARRNKWRASLGKLRDMDPRVVIPGHCSPEKLNLEDASGIDYTLRYLDVYEEVLATAKTGDELVDGVQSQFPGVKAIDYGLHWQARPF